LSSPLRSVPTYIIHISPAKANPSLDRLIRSVLSAVQNSTSNCTAKEDLTYKVGWHQNVLPVINTLSGLYYL